MRALTRLAEVHGDTKRAGASKGLVRTISFSQTQLIQRFHLASYGLIDYLIKILDDELA